MLKIVQQRILNQQAGQFVTLKSGGDFDAQQAAQNTTVQKISQPAPNVEKTGAKSFDPTILKGEQQIDRAENPIEEKSENVELNESSLKLETKHRETVFSLEQNSASETVESKTTQDALEGQKGANQSSLSKLAASQLAQNASNTQHVQNVKFSHANTNEKPSIEHKETVAQAKTDENKTAQLQNHSVASSINIQFKPVSENSIQQTNSGKPSSIKVEQTDHQRIVRKDSQSIDALQQASSSVSSSVANQANQFSIVSKAIGQSGAIEQYRILKESSNMEASNAAQRLEQSHNKPQKNPSVQGEMKKTIDNLNVKIQKSSVEPLGEAADETASQQIGLLAQKAELVVNGTKRRDVQTNSERTAAVQVPSQPSFVLSAAQVKLIVDNLSRYVQHLTSETTQFKHVKKDLPETIKIREPIKIETLKLTVAKELKQNVQEPIQERVEKLEKTEQVREALNGKAAKRVYEQEQPIVQHVRIEQRDIDQVVVRVEQQQRSDNLQTIVETIKQMRETLVERAEVQLSPPTLGKLEIELVKQQDRLTVLMRVSTPEAKELLESSSKELASRLSSLGFKVEQIEVRFNPKFDQERTDEEREHNQQFDQQGQQQRKKQEADEDDQRD